MKICASTASSSQELSGESSPGSSWRFVLPVFVLHALVTAWVMSQHEPWRDEADGWLLARDAADLASLRQYAANSGHPLLWHLLLMPFARLGLPYWSMQLLHWAIGELTILVLLRWSPFSRLEKALLVSSFILGYEYVVVSRNYGLTTLLLFISVALATAKTPSWVAAAVALSLAGQANILGAAVSIALAIAISLSQPGLLFSARGRLAGALYAMSLIGLVALMLPTGDGQFAARPPPFRPLYAGVALCNGFLPTSSEWGWASYLAPPFALMAAWSVSIQLLAARPALVGWWCGFIGLSYVFTCHHAGTTRQHGMVLILTICMLWLARRWSCSRASLGALRRLRAEQALNVILLVGVPATFVTWARDLVLPFSGARDTALWLQEHGLDLGPIAAHSPPVTSAVLPYLRIRTLHYPALGTEGSHMRWDREYVASLRVSLETVAGRLAAHGSPKVLLLSSPLPDEAAAAYELLWESSPDSLTGERFWIYSRRAETVR